MVKRVEKSIEEYTGGEEEGKGRLEKWAIHKYEALVKKYEKLYSRFNELYNISVKYSSEKANLTILIIRS